MSISYTLESFLNAICRDVSVADMEMQLLQQKAWQELVNTKFTLQDPGKPDSLADLRTQIMQDIETDKHLALSEVSLNFSLIHRSAWTRFWYRVRHPFARSNPAFKLGSSADSRVGIQFNLQIKRKAGGQWMLEETQPEIFNEPLEFLG